MICDEREKVFPDIMVILLDVVQGTVTYAASEILILSWNEKVCEQETSILEHAYHEE